MCLNTPDDLPVVPGMDTTPGDEDLLAWYYDRDDSEEVDKRSSSEVPLNTSKG